MPASPSATGYLTTTMWASTKSGITPTVALDLALNPDFAQVEADQAVVKVNERFPIFFEEKRPFFLEGIDVFQTRLNVLHTRTIIAPDYAVKLTGKSGRNSFGFLLASDNAPGTFSAKRIGLRPQQSHVLCKDVLLIPAQFLTLP